MGEQMWSGLAHVIPRTTGPQPKGAAGGCVNVVALSENISPDRKLRFGVIHARETDTDIN
jgi:hypothetical protein